MWSNCKTNLHAPHDRVRTAYVQTTQDKPREPGTACTQASINRHVHATNGVDMVGDGNRGHNGLPKTKDLVDTTPQGRSRDHAALRSFTKHAESYATLPAKRPHANIHQTNIPQCPVSATIVSVSTIVYKVVCTDLVVAVLFSLHLLNCTVARPCTTHSLLSG